MGASRPHATRLAHLPWAYSCVSPAHTIPPAPADDALRLTQAISQTSLSHTHTHKENASILEKCLACEGMQHSSHPSRTPQGPEHCAVRLTN